MQLNLIYHFQSSRNEEGVFRTASYQVIHFFSEEGFLEEKMLKEKALSIPQADSEKLSFLSLDDLREFALQVTKDQNASEVRLISAQDYNIGIDGAKDLKSFQEIFTKFGEVAQNPEARKRKGILGKLFS